MIIVLNISELISDKDKILGINVLDIYISELISETDENISMLDIYISDLKSEKEYE